MMDRKVGQNMKLISWNVNGLRAIYKKDFENIFKDVDADVFCLQETKMQEGQLDVDFEGYEKYFNYAERKGYSGTAIFTKIKPKKVTYGIGIVAGVNGDEVKIEFNSGQKRKFSGKVLIDNNLIIVIN